MQRPFFQTRLLCLVLAAFSSNWSRAETRLQVKPGQRQLFLDDVGISKMVGLKRVLHRPKKRGAVIRSPKPEQTIQIRSAPVWDPVKKQYMLWVLSIDQVLWTSKDGLHWTPGPKTNKVFNMVVRDPHDPDPKRRFKAALTNSGFAVSPDGVTWTKLPVPAIQSFDEANFSYDPQHRLFIHTVKRTGLYGRSVAVATSRDFKTWKDYGVVFHADQQDQAIGIRRIKERLKNPLLKQTEFNVPKYYSIQIYNMGLFHYEGLYIGLPSVYHHTGKVPTNWPGFDKLNLSPTILGLVRRYGDYTGFYNIQIVSTRDFKSWNRVGKRRPFISASPLNSGAYDTQTIIGPSAPIVRGDELWFYYTGIQHYAFIKSGDDPAYEDYAPDKGGICLAVLRRDGFISLDATEKPGRITTRIFVCPGSTIKVNVAFRKNGRLTAELLDESGKVVANSKPIVVGTTKGQLKWQNKVELKGKQVQLRFTLKNASFYSYWID